MIVTCPQCQTRFRIPDERVTAKGVKVRCTRCRHTFRVSRPAEPVEPSEDPFAQFAPPDALSEEDKTPTRGIPAGAALGVQVEPAGAPPADDFDVDVETPDAKKKQLPAWSFPPPPPRAPDSATPQPPPEPLDDPTPRVALARIGMVRQLKVVPAREEEHVDEASALEGLADAPLELDTGGSPHSAWQGSIEGGLELPDAAAELDFGDLNPEATAAPVPRPSTTPVPAPGPGGGRLDFDAMQSAPALVRAPTSPAASDLSFGDLEFPPPPEPRSDPGFDFGDLDLPPSPAARAETGLDLDDEEHSPPPAPPPTTETKTPTGELFGRSATRIDEDSFPADNREADRAALFDMPSSAPSEETAAGPSSLLADVPDAIPDAPVHPSAGLPAVPTSSVGRVSRPPTGTSVLGLEERRERGTARRLSGALVNIGVAAVLVVVLAAVGNVYVNEGRLDWAALSPHRWASLFVPPSGIVTLDVSNGLYETRGGHPLAYVRGRVENRGVVPGQVKVRAEIWDGSQLLGSSEGLAGVLPTPEEMVEASTPRDVEALRARLQQGAPTLSPGKGTDFVLLFDTPPTEAAGLRLKVTAAAADGR